MQFDWFTFGASLFNFVLLLLLLRVLVFKRVVRAMETREKRLARQWDEAHDAESEAEQKKHRYEQELERIEEKRKATIEEAQEEIRNDRENRLEELNQEMNQKRRAWEESIQAEHRQFLSEVRTKLGEATVETVRATLEELADASLEEKLVDRFLREYEEDHPNADGTVQVYTGMPLPEEARRRIKSRISEIHADASDVNVAVDKDLLCGIEVRLKDRRIGFSLAHHLDAVEGRLRDLLTSEEGPTGE